MLALLMGLFCNEVSLVSESTQPFYQGTERWQMSRIFNVKHPRFVYQTTKVFFSDFMLLFYKYSEHTHK
jgi:hypothetical protein